MFYQIIRNKPILLVVTIFLMFCNQIYAGWIIYEKSYESGSDNEAKYVYFIQDQQLKLVEDDLETIFNLKNNSVTFIIPSKSIYWKGSVDDYNSGYKNVVNKYFEEQLKDTPKEKVEMARATYEYYLANLQDSTNMNQNDLDMLILNTGKKAKIAGYNSMMFGLYVNKDLRKEVWISKEINMNHTFDMVKYNGMLNKIGMGMMDDLNSRASKAYAQLLQSGFLMKTVEFGYELSFTREVYKVKQKDLKPNRFSPPEKYTEVAFSDLGLFDLPAK
ncbi:MAG: DUF4412 domain-containing protein [Bacteroidales bacterium]|nr:DUF4412 domain-containing protein [Bacteroidales bacterium]